MNIYVYSDESGVFDRVHEDYYVFGGIILLGNEQKDAWARRYIAAEKTLRQSKAYPRNIELKASVLNTGEKSKLFRSLNGCYKFGVIVSQRQVLQEIYQNKKTKQRYLDYAFKISLKRALERMISQGVFSPIDVNNIYCNVDEHTTATDGRYELREALEREFKLGTFNRNYCKFFPPLFPTIESVSVYYCNSATKTLVRSADIVANKLYNLAVQNNIQKISEISNLYITYLP